MRGSVTRQQPAQPDNSEPHSLPGRLPQVSFPLFGRGTEVEQGPAVRVGSSDSGRNWNGLRNQASLSWYTDGETEAQRRGASCPKRTARQAQSRPLPSVMRLARAVGDLGRDSSLFLSPAFVESRDRLERIITYVSKASTSQ